MRGKTPTGRKNKVRIKCPGCGVTMERQDKGGIVEKQKRLIDVKPSADLRWSLDIECPKCNAEIDLAAGDDDNTYSNAIFNNKWDDLVDEEITCPECGHIFLIGSVEY